MKQPDGDNAGSGSGVVLLSGECRPLRRALRPLVWVVLEEVALDAVVEDGSLVARTSARHVAERLGVNPSTAAEALRVLGRRGLVGLEREKGPAGRFGLSVYQFRPPTGLCVVQPCTAEPFMVAPSMVEPNTVGPLVASLCVAESNVESSRLETAAPGRASRPAVGTDSGPTSDHDSSDATLGQGSPVSRPRSTAPAGSSRHCPGQTVLDLGLGSS